MAGLEMGLDTQCLYGARILWRELRDLFGHVSARRAESDGFWLAMVRVPAEPRLWDEVMWFDWDGIQRFGEQSPPSEIHLHTAIYRHRPDVASVVHCHPHAATALSTTGRTIYALTHQSARYGEGVPVFDGDFIDRPEVGQALAECLGDAPAVLMRGHGVVAVGRSVADAVTNALFLEQAAQQQVIARTLGEPALFPARLREYHLPGEGAGAYLWRQLLWELATEGRPYARPSRA